MPACAELRGVGEGAVPVLSPGECVCLANGFAQGQQPQEEVGWSKGSHGRLLEKKTNETLVLSS